VYIFNITFVVDKGLEAPFLGHLKEVVAPLIDSSELTIGTKTLQLLTEIDQASVTFTQQIFFADAADCLEFENRFLDKIWEKLNEKMINNYLTFSTLLQEV
jgi:Domain of unknown function (DUF4286)